MSRLAACICALLLAAPPALGDPLADPAGQPLTTTGSAAESSIPAAGLLEDLEIAREAYTTLHPGLYRYNTPAQIEAGFEQLAAAFEEGLTLREAYLAFAELLARIRCGHTYANFWNQSDEVQEQLFRGADKVPFTFRILDDRLVVTRSAVDDPRPEPGLATQ